jgi:hypothetical protein
LKYDYKVKNVIGEGERNTIVRCPFRLVYLLSKPSLEGNKDGGLYVLRKFEDKHIHPLNR